jgi:hypothetical protein
MADMDNQTFKERWGLPIAIGVIVCVIWAFISCLAAIASPYLKPILYGLVGAAAVLLCGISIAILKRIPRPRVIPTGKNIEACVRSWLDNQRIAVKSDPSPDNYFRLRITLDSGKFLTAVRTKDQPDYIEIITNMSVHGDQLTELHQFSDDEIEQFSWDTQVELARAQVGYSGLQTPFENFIIHRRVPIQHNLTEFAFISVVGSVEAAMNLVNLMFRKARMKAARRSATPTTTDPI